MQPEITAERYHDISCGHRVAGHESKCAFLHGHNYRIHFRLAGMTPQGSRLDSVGRVLDFSAIKERLCIWLEENWDHKFLAWEKDMLMKTMIVPFGEASDMVNRSIVWVPFNPTAENMATHLLRVIGPAQLQDTDTHLTWVKVEETRKCSAAASWGDR